MHDPIWFALAVVLTGMGGAWTWYALRHRGLAAGVRGAALTLLPPAAYLTGTLQLAGDIGQSVADWATRLVFSPTVWLGIVVFGVSAALFGLSGFMRGRGLGAGRSGPPSEERPGRSQRTVGQLEVSKGRPAPAIDDDLGDIEAILRKRGIT